MSKYARDPDYAKPPQWGRLYRKHWPHNTDPCSRHAKMVCAMLRDPKHTVRRMLMDSGWEPDHWASSIEATIQNLWEAREHLEYVDGKWQAR